MKVISTGNRYELHSDMMKTHDQLPAQVYTVVFDQMCGFALYRHADIEIGEKVYGVHEEKVDKVLRSFGAFERSLGVILSGNKGIGKSLFAKMLAVRAVKAGIPVLIVDRFIPGIASYLESIEQEVMVMFDEFDKTFGEVTAGENEAKPQAGLLSLFDGMAQGKKLFVITCNHLQSLNDYLINRPGRFHYHFRFDYPNGAEIREYLSDKLKPAFAAEIEKVIAFAQRVNLNYDCLRAIAFELNCGEPFEQAIADLNILNLNEERYNVTVFLANNKQYTRKNIRLDLFNHDEQTDIWMSDGNECNDVRLHFNAAHCIYDAIKDVTMVEGANITLQWDEPDNHEGDEWNPRYAVISRASGKNYHYLAA